MNPYDRALSRTPHGSQTRSKGAAQFPATYPKLLARGKGSHVWDPEGREYGDIIDSVNRIADTMGRVRFLEGKLRELEERSRAYELPGFE